MIEAVASKVFIPLTVGGGVRKVQDVRRREAAEELVLGLLVGAVPAVDKDHEPDRDGSQHHDACPVFGRADREQDRADDRP